MAIFSAASRPSGELVIRKHGQVVKAPLAWRLRNWLTWRFISGWLAVMLAKSLTRLTALLGARMVSITSELAIQVRRFYDDAEREYYVHLVRAGRRDEAEAYAASRTYIEDYGVVSYRVVTDAFVAYLVDDMDNASGGADISLFNYHGIGTTNTAEAAGDTALAAESTTALNPDNTRATGTRSQPASNQFRSSGTLTADASIAAVEHGLFTQAATGGGTLADRSVYSVVNIASGENITTQYTITFNSGG